jgi:TM2 domain-containing membrane protein YozV
MNKETYFKTLNIIRELLTPESRNSFDIQMVSEQKNTTTAFILSLFLGGLAIDRFYIGDIGMGFAKLIASLLILLSPFFVVFCILDLFFIMGSTRANNIKIARTIASSFVKNAPAISISSKGENQWAA